MSKKKFNPEDWKDPGPAAPAPPKTEQTKQPARPAAANPSYSATLDDQIERLTARIEATGTDITAGYDHWRDLGFALTDALGENGRSYYHRLSRFYPGYSEQECDAQYDKCMRARGHGITIRTLFHLAKENGVSVSFPAEKPQQNFPSPDGNDGTNGMMEIAAPESMPTFSRELYGHLPGLLDEVARNARSDEDADVLILGALVTWSACLVKVYGVYDNKKVYPNLFLYVTAPASAGKGRLSLCRRLAQPIHDQLRQLYRDDMDEYRVQKARFDQAKKKNPDLEPPEEPPLRMLIIPANSSSTSVYQILSDNGGGGLMFETEGDTLANVFASDYGNYSDGFRKAFHHEPISYTRRKDREFVELLRPRLSAVLSGTPRQISALIPDAENGLFSRFIFYYLNFRLEWIDVFARTSNTTLEEIFDDIGYGFLELYQRLEMQPELEFSLTPGQQSAFHDYYRSTQEQYYYLFGEDIIGSVRRLGLITFRLAMVLSALRLHDTGEVVTTLICDDEDFRSAMAIARALIRHTVRVYRELSSADLGKPAAERSDRQQQFLSSLPATFSTQAFLQLAGRLGITQPTAERYISAWCKTASSTASNKATTKRPPNPVILNEVKNLNNPHMKILIDNGHGSNTPGKCFPDRRYHEWSYTRQIAAAIVRQLKYAGYDADLLVPEDYDVSLRTRVERANTWCRQLGKKNVCLISIHTNAAGNGRQWMTARGWCCYTSRGQTAGDRLATCLYEAASLHLPGHKIRKDYSDGDPDWESDFYILKNTLCAAALSENLFHDNADDLAFLESAPGRQTIIDLHVRGIIDYVNG